MLRPSARKQTFVLKVQPFRATNQLSHRQYIQLIIVPVVFTLASFVGIAVTSAGIALYGQVIWDPLKLIDHWDNRAAAFFTSFAFTLGTLGTNVSANSLSAGNDMTALWPRYINIQRGQVICAILGGWALCPWEILARCVPSLKKTLGILFRDGSLIPCCTVRRASWPSWAVTPSSSVLSPESWSLM
jgi:cytosine/uracil/thiamine/allantoin permease